MHVSLVETEAEEWQVARRRHMRIRRLREICILCVMCVTLETLVHFHYTFTL